MPEDTASRITSIWKPHRPEPQKYLRPEVIEKHLEQFKGGVARIMTADNLRVYGPKREDGTSFVFPKSQVADAMKFAQGDRRKLEGALGLQPGDLGADALVLVEIDQPEKYNIRIPTGNEAGANKDWIPGGFLPKKRGKEGLRETVLDLNGVPDSAWTTTPLSLK